MPTSPIHLKTPAPGRSGPGRDPIPTHLSAPERTATPS
ncbi:Hypothetical Protein XCAW_00572 [Xanthomonas citri subsp. citri Aw12879]|nr:Hypothetical Protein XCAW_00572 [Xanthomonas citri subsp. citri Aw12879]